MGAEGSLHVGVVGLGDMGIHLAANLAKNNFKTKGYDLRQQRVDLLQNVGAEPAASLAEIAQQCDRVFLMVMNGKQVAEVLLGPNGLINQNQGKLCVIVTATILPSELEELVPHIEEVGIELIDSPVSGGLSGASEGILTLMVAGNPETVELHTDVLDAISSTIIRVGDRPGCGQRVKAALQSCLGSVFASILEAKVLASRMGISDEIIKAVFSSALLDRPSIRTCLNSAVERKFNGTGSGISTIYKDLSISLSMAREVGMPMSVAAAAFQLFESSKSMFPDEDNWAACKVLETLSQRHEISKSSES